MSTGREACPPHTAYRLLDGYSLEITAKDRDRLCAVRELIPDGACVSITFLRGDDMDLLADTAGHVRALGLVPIPHIAARCIGSALELQRFLAALGDKAAIDRAFVIGGDAPQPLGPFVDARAILETGLLAAHGVKTVGIGGYPQGHPAIPTPVLWRALAEKCELIGRQGLEAEIVTQFAFDARPVARWIGEADERGIEADIRVGIPGPATAKALLNFALRCGVGASTRMLARYGVSIARLFATTTADAFLADLTRALAGRRRRVGVHVYPFGGLEAAVAWAASHGHDEETR
jgi:methylenetetrahydrofolate reductase (NADPH)